MIDLNNADSISNWNSIFLSSSNDPCNNLLGFLRDLSYIFVVCTKIQNTCLLYFVYRLDLSFPHGNLLLKPDKDVHLSGLC